MQSSIQTTSTALTATQPALTPPPPVELLTQVEMAQRLGINRRTLHSWVLSGAVPMIKIRGFCRFEPAKVWAALQQHEVRAAGAAKSASASREGALNAAAASTTETRSA
ncbi:MAG: helix-turn-helix domain-containing protein [Verrucomicrobia bacterium]|nr:helix-turn-helix domain-containing protein [Verrucomicrobiota bacterium]